MQATGVVDQPDEEAMDAGYEAGVRLLARREHSSQELARKLGARGYEQRVIELVLDRLVRQGYLSDERFTEVFVRQRCQQGQGPVKIVSDLSQRGIDERLARYYLDQQSVDWIEQARAVRVRRFGEALPDDRRERARQARFLASRGFSAEQVYSVLDSRARD
ncbi:regulatory protein RecX [Aquisalimonas asiatica]|uniref:Regulatory protein RecX n=1 Tax=Aquisalimonas asiatica TaxID=406100 RepID=A0A1H8PTH7_9GAMM|nr:regulatory protein RecX [Aquisalimonas asiatica]SEO44843.1 regulatory protein [Aquisalimonas asiatica]